MKWSGAAPAEDNGLSARFIHHSVALESARNANRFAFARIGRDQSRIWPRTESLRAGHRVGRNQLDHAQSIFAVGDKRKLGGVDAADLHRARVVERAAGVKHLVEPRALRIFDIDNRQTFRTIGDISVSARDVEAPGISQPNDSTSHRNRSLGICDVENFQTVIICDEGVAKLNRDAFRIAQKISRELSDESRMHRIARIDHEQNRAAS